MSPVRVKGFTFHVQGCRLSERLKYEILGLNRPPPATRSVTHDDRRIVNCLETGTGGEDSACAGIDRKNGPSSM